MRMYFILSYSDFFWECLGVGIFHIFSPTRWGCMLEGSATKLYWVEQQWRTDLAHMICRGWQTVFVAQSCSVLVATSSLSSHALLLLEVWQVFLFHGRGERGEGKKLGDGRCLLGYLPLLLAQVQKKSRSVYSQDEVPGQGLHLDNT